MENIHPNTCTGEETGAHIDIVTLRSDGCPIQDSDNNVNAVDMEGNAALSLALMQGCDLKAIKSLLVEGADANKSNYAGQSPLCIALQHPDCSDLVDLILKAGASKNACSMHNSLLHCYSANAKEIKPIVLKLLLIKQIGIQRFYHESLCLALDRATVGRLDIVKMLLEMGCYFNKCMLHESSFRCYFDERDSDTGVSKDLDEEVINFLLNNVTIERRGYCCLQSPLCVVLNDSKCTSAIVKLFLVAEVLFRKCYVHRSALHCYIDVAIDACGVRSNRSLNTNILKLFLDEGADIHGVDFLGASALYMAMHYCDCSADVLQLFLDAGASIDGCNLHGSLLMCYVLSNKVRADAIKLLLDQGVDAHEISYNGDTPLHAALRYSQYEVAAIKMLIDHPKFDINKRGRNKSSFLHCALENSYYKRDIVKLLLNRGARADTLDSKGYTTLQLAVRNSKCNTDIMKMLLDKGCPVFTNNLEMPLEMVLKTTIRVDVVRLLLTAGAPFNRKHNNDPSSLEWILMMYNSMQKQDNSTLGCLEMFVKYALLVTPDLDINNLIKVWIYSHFKVKAILSYVRRCVNEIQHMDLQCIAPGITLREFAAGLKKEVMYDLDVLLKVLARNDYPIYFDIISTRVKRVLMEDKLLESHAYLMSDLPCKGKRIVLDRYSTCHIGYFLSDQDLLSYLVVYYAS